MAYRHSKLTKSIWGRLGIALGSTWHRFGVDLGSIWRRLWINLGSVWGQFVIDLGSMWGRLGIDPLRVGFWSVSGRSRVGFGLVSGRFGREPLLGHALLCRQEEIARAEHLGMIFAFFGGGFSDFSKVSANLRKTSVKSAARN